MSTAVAAPAAEVEQKPRPAWLENLILTALSMLLALGVGAVLIAFSDPDVTSALPYFFADPTSTLNAMWTAVAESYSALFQGAVLNFGGDSLAQTVRPMTETLVVAAPLIAAGLSVALAFKAGLFNIGAEGQILIGAACAAYVGFTWHLPAGVHLVVAVAAGMLGGAFWAGIAGLLKATTGAHEVITTIMLNYVARYLVAFLLTTSAFQRPGRNDPISPIVDESAQLTRLLGDQFRLHLGIVLSLLAAGFVWWLLNRSTIGFRFRAVGANAAAAKTAGIHVGRSIFGVMAIAGALSGLAAVNQILGTEKALTGGISAGIGFDAITVALLGRGSPVGVVLAGLLFGGLKAGGVSMQAQTGTPIDIVLVVQSLIVLFIAAPPLVRAIFHIRRGGMESMQMVKGWAE
jgi:general nucleoside transport system permease protein